MLYRTERDVLQLRQDAWESKGYIDYESGFTVTLKSFMVSKCSMLAWKKNHVICFVTYSLNMTTITNKEMHHVL
jgi:hypothetical protein